MGPSGSTNTRERLIEAAIQMLDEGGESAVRIKIVAAMAHITEPSVYHFFGSRAGLIEAAQIERFHRSQLDVVTNFKTLIHACNTQDEFADVVRQVLLGTYSEPRAPYRSIRAEIIGSAQSRSALREVLVAAQREVHASLAEQIEFAKSKGWVRKNLNSLAMASWITSINHGRTVIDLDDSYELGDEWNELSVEAALHLVLAPHD